MTGSTTSIFKKLILGLAIAAVTLLPISLWIHHKLSPSEIRRDLNQIDTMAQTAGEVTAQYLDEGSQVVIIRYPTELSKTLAKQAQAFESRLLQEGQVILIANEELRPSTTPGKETFTLTELLRIHQTYPAADALISLIGAPRGALYEPDLALPLIVALNSEPMENAEQLFNLGIVQMALIPDLFPTAGSDSTTTNSLQSSYLITTIENVRSILY